jgi:hypothetical protein
MIAVSDKARDYLLKKSGAIYLFNARPISLCCGRINFGPSVRPGKPKNITDYKAQIINKIYVYLPQGFLSPYPLTIELQNCLGFRMLHVVGWKLI